VINILLVEDSAADVDLVREALDNAQLQYTLRIAGDVDEAKECFAKMPRKEGCPDVLLMDLNLPQGSGLDLLRIFREDPDWKKVPVIVVSSSNAKRDRDQAASLGAVDYFRKPTDLNEFLLLGPTIIKWLVTVKPRRV
jgi:pentatricopeptide repeat protein